MRNDRPPSSDLDAARSLTLHLPQALLDRLEAHAQAAGQGIDRALVEALDAYFHEVRSHQRFLN